MKKKVRTFWTVVALILVMEVATVLVVRYWYDIFPPRDVGVLYKHYADNEHIDASFIKGYRINDTLRLNVTVLVARDSIGFSQLLNDFHINTPEQRRMFLDSIYRANNLPIPPDFRTLPSVKFFRAPRNDPFNLIHENGRHFSPDDYQMVFRYSDSTLYTFDTHTQEERTAVIFFKASETFKDVDPEAKELYDNIQKGSNKNHNKSSK
ncbi:MAG: hypothetical protein K5867_09265 [Bacteroidales bacterium]|nr:hypothetical protein [Bacteroidales bacterium]